MNNRTPSDVNPVLAYGRADHVVAGNAARLPWGMISIAIFVLGELLPMILAITNVVDTPLFVTAVVVVAGLCTAGIGIAKWQRPWLCVAATVLHLSVGLLLLLGYVMARSIPIGGH